MEPRLPIDGSQSTLLVIRGGAGGIGLPLYSARGLHQTLEPIAAATMQRRTVNGKLVSLAPLQFALFKSTITGADQEPPELLSNTPGAEVFVDCIVEVPFVIRVGAAAIRPAVPGSIRVEDGFQFYRPSLHMLVVGWSYDSDEWGAQVGWKLDLEEVER